MLSWFTFPTCGSLPNPLCLSYINIFSHFLSWTLTTFPHLAPACASFSDRAPRLNSFHGEFVIKSYHKTAFKDAQMLRQCSANAPENRPKSAFCRNKYRNIFRPWPLLDMPGVGFKHGVAVPWIILAWSSKVSRCRPLFYCEIFNDSFKKVWSPSPNVAKPRSREAMKAA